MRKLIPAFAFSLAAIYGYAEPAEQTTLAEQEEVVAVDEAAEESEEIAENEELLEEALLKAKAAKN